MPSTNVIKLTAGLEATAGTVVSGSKVIPISGIVGIDRVANTGPDPAIVGSNMSTGDYLLFADVAGDIPLAVRPVGGMGLTLKSLLGTENAVAQIGACMRLKYSGSGASCKITTSSDDDELISFNGVKGSETADSNFGTTGVIDLSATSFDTLAELVAAIDAYNDYECEKIFGADAFDTTTTVITAEKQGKDNWVYVWFDAAASGVYRHEFVVNLTNTERPTITLYKEGYQDNFRYSGCVVDSMNISAALKAMAEGSASILGFSEAGSQSASALTLEEVDPLIFYKGDFTLGGNSYNFTRNFDFSFNNSHNPDGYGGGSVDRQYHQKGMFESTGTMQVRLDSSSFLERAKMFADTKVAVSIELEGKIISGVIPEYMLLELPYCAITSYEFVENTGVFDATIGLKAISPKGTSYNDPVTITMINTDSAVY